MSSLNIRAAKTDNNAKRFRRRGRRATTTSSGTFSFLMIAVSKSASNCFTGTCVIIPLQVPDSAIHKAKQVKGNHLFYFASTKFKPLIPISSIIRLCP